MSKKGYGATDSGGGLASIANAAGIDTSGAMEQGMLGGLESQMQSYMGMDHHSVGSLMEDFREMDTDGSHTVTREEWAAKHNGDMTEFDKYDLDGDGIIDEGEELRVRMEDLCVEHEELAVFADELHNTPATDKELRKIYNLFLEPLRVTCAELNYFHSLDKALSLTIMILGTLVPMLHLMGFSSQQCAIVGAAIPLLQGLNLKFQPHKKMIELERVKTACMSEGHHFFSLTGEYHDHEDHSDAHRHFLETIEGHRGKKKTKKKDKKDKDKQDAKERAAHEHDEKDDKKDDKGAKGKSPAPQTHKGGPVQRAISKSALEVRLGDGDEVHSLPMGDGFGSLDELLDEAESVLGVEIVSVYYDESDDDDEITKDKEVKKLVHGEKIRFTVKEARKRRGRK